MTGATQPSDVMAAAKAAMEAFQTSTARGFPGVVKTAKPRAKKVDGQLALIGAEVSKKEKSAKTEPEPTLIQAALRLPVRACPVLERERRVPLAFREVILVDARSFVVRAMVGTSNIYSRFLDGVRSYTHDSIAAIEEACPEASGTAWQGCVLVNINGPEPGDRLFVERWIMAQDEREAAWLQCRADPQAWRKRS